MSISREQDPVFEAEVPVAIIGAGAAGLVAALACRAEGVEPLVLERDAVPRGSTSLSAGLIPAAGTRFQRAHGIADDAETFAADIQRKAHGEAEPGTVATVAREAAPTLEWLADVHGLDFSVVHDFDYPGHSHRRMHGLPSRSGAELVDRLRAAAEAAGVPLLTEARVTTLVMDQHGAIRGLVAERPDGTRERIGARAIVLACCGYAGNKALVARYIPELAEAVYFGHPGNEGEALAWGEALGAALRDMTGHQGHGSIAHPQGILVSWAVIMEGGFQLNAAGERFWNEASGYSEAGRAVMGQPGHIAWDIFDQRIAGITRQFEDFRQAEAQGAVLVADSVEELARITKLPLESAMASVAALKQAGVTDGFGRSWAGVAPLAPPYCAVRVTAALFHSQGGMVVDDRARVRLAEGGVIPNLFAAGGAACGVSGPDASGYLSGNGLLSAVTLGRIAGEQAASLGRG
ncbi:FAD-dependent oxidoreductase [Falsiroseomonas selenitidurans]|uniref:FAD-dependent oxidoreductase n=1 Tax=Falsiroseomonas selenitidurans TaxID=2716335 RepID=A0ABX1E4H4_9PROT|nr:FAD-dependent oxidoreductase [Falsiroseomonas selenitidurans]NKC30713.1 FAD-dependent oxidoreductase [Falsiroseomonas selenitidurans]